MNDKAVDHPPHYGGADNPYEAIKVIEAWGLGFSLGNAVKYISRAGRKEASKLVEDLKKARWYIDRAIAAEEANDHLCRNCKSARTLRRAELGGNKVTETLECMTCGEVRDMPSGDVVRAAP